MAVCKIEGIICRAIQQGISVSAVPANIMISWSGTQGCGYLRYHLVKYSVLVRFSAVYKVSVVNDKYRILSVHLFDYLPKSIISIPIISEDDVFILPSVV